VRTLNPEDIEDLAIGASALGGGGGGDPYMSKLMAQQAIAAHGPVRVLDPDELDDLDLIIPLGMIGAPTVVLERPFAADSFFRAFKMLEQHLGRQVRATMPIEIGGFNALIPIVMAARLGLPLVDADGMGRAFPEIQMTAFTIQGVAACPLALADDRGNQTIVESADNFWAEKLVRSLVVDMGCAAASALYPITGQQLKTASIRHSISLAMQIGLALRGARDAEHGPIEAVRRMLGGAVIFQGRVVDVQRHADTGFARGEAIVEGARDQRASTLTIQFQNEYLIASTEDAILATTPDLIGIFDARTCAPIPVEALRYGFQVIVMGIPCSPVWRTPAGLDLVGPRAFGYPIDYAPIEDSICGDRPIHN
jgi:uncharacterized protein